MRSLPLSALFVVPHWNTSGLRHLLAPSTRRLLQPQSGGDQASRHALSQSRHHYRLLGSVFSLEFASPELEALVHPVLAHLEVRAPRVSGRVFAVTHRASGYHLREAGRLVLSCGVPEGLVPLVVVFLGHAALTRYPHFLTLHAAALGHPGGALVLAGPSGSGKSTLAAALMMSGWRYFSDDLTVLAEQTLKVVPFPLNLCLKRGAWDMVRPWVPEIAALPVHLRYDGKQVRYLPPSAAARAKRPMAVRWLLFPRVVAGAEAQLYPIERAEALQLLVQNSEHAALPPADLVRTLDDWIADIEVHRLDFSDLAAAVACIQRMAQGPGRTRTET
jgi:hypothetical protein